MSKAITYNDLGKKTAFTQASLFKKGRLLYVMVLEDREFQFLFSIKHSFEFIRPEAKWFKIAVFHAEQDNLTRFVLHFGDYFLLWATFLVHFNAFELK